ncbi:hydroxyethylthiazole kinase [Solicola sp. PLA-1-18]|uniref:hydroxyethylthiazole kinase n=1 Tax=Solicola sp. PLA-1-18 TaxID=3380532 RepID=UPI003B7BAF79
MSADALVRAGQIHAEVRERTPLVQCLTNYVSMDVAANVLLAAGASPAMVHDEREAGEFAALAGAVVVNIGTPSPPWVDGMTAAATVARERGTPWVLDPVAVGATGYRRETVAGLMEHRPTVVRGNASEIIAIATQQAHGRGVDTDGDLGDVAIAVELARTTGAVVAVTGAEDVVTDGRRVVRVRGGDPRMPMITALGCSASALVGAFCAVEDDPLEATVAALAVLSAAGGRAGARAHGPGSLRWMLVDELSTIDADALPSHVRVVADEA